MITSTKTHKLIRKLCCPIIIKIITILAINGKICQAKISVNFSNAETPFLNLLINEPLILSEKTYKSDTVAFEKNIIKSFLDIHF